ncbi:elongation factor G [Pseudoxanthomonas dokdonensis]|uniref:Elongation factor G n=1 Tax=Pseudoxanthomonas dokdonensis TaxID=344882 RepID=A0A0R0CFI1_9GAMM|nr:elongation factor G [Pseudoxanthomonas dokdonensis]KRG68011.1 elongation factor G [Pseudoxanthomonas dokdonensis]
MSYTTQDIRNLALAGHAGTGKTTLFEALLHAGGQLQATGTIERGNTVSDHDPMEKSRRHSLDSAIASFDHGGIHLNLIDTPGYPDFRGPALSALSVTDTAVIVIDADSGLTHGGRRLLERARQRGLCRAIVVNKIDQDDADCARVLAGLREQLGPEALPLNLPADNGRRVVDCFRQSDGDCDLGDVARWHQHIIDQVVEVNESVMERFLDAGEQALSGQQLHDAFEQCLREGHLLPVCFVSARTGTGVAELLAIIESLFPNPTEANPPALVRGHGTGSVRFSAHATADGHVIADVFKLINDPFVGKLGIFRVYQGSVRKDASLLLDEARKPFKVAHLYRIRGKDHEEIDAAIAGDIAAIARIDDLHFDALLHDSHDEDQVHLAPLELPAPMFGLAIEATSKGQEQKLALALAKLAEEDPAFVVEHNAELNETVIRGLSDLHLRVMLERLKERHGVEVTTHPPRIAYRETIAASADGQHRHKKQSGGAGQFGEVQLSVEPLPRGQGFEFIDAVKGGTIPGQFIPAVEKGVRQVLDSGAIAGYPLQDVRVTVRDGKHHPVDSKEVAFVVAGRKAFLEAIAKARPQLLEPIVDLEVRVPEAQVGDITGGLAARRARINGTDSERGDIVVRAQVPLSELDGYATEIKSISAGRGSYAIEFSHYEPVPAAVQQRLTSQYRPRADDD